MRWFVEHPYMTFFLALAGLAIGVLSLVEPKYALVTSGDVCGFNEKTVSYREHEFKLCTHPSHGVASYQHSEIVRDSSGWRDGGYNQLAWCNEVKRRKERAVGESIVWGEETRSENSKKDIFGHVEYNYHCSIPARWGPVFVASRSAACGNEPYSERIEREPKTCIDESTRIGWKWSWQ